MLLDVSDRAIVIVGGGSVAARKAAGLLAAGAMRITVVAPEFRGEFAPTVQRIAGRYRAEHLDGAQIVFAATDDADVNRAVVRDAHQRGALACRADRDAADGDDAGGDASASGDFITPAQARRGPVHVSVSAGSAALAALIRDGILNRWDDGWTALAEAMQTIRPRVLAARQLDATARKTIFRELATADAIAVARSGGADAVARWLDARHPGWSD